jgi:hypothetical protein
VLHGTFLIKTDENGVVDMVFHPNTVSALPENDALIDIQLPLMPGLPATLQKFTAYQGSSLGADQYFNVKVPLQRNEIAIA